MKFVICSGWNEIREIKDFFLDMAVGAYKSKETEFGEEALKRLEQIYF
jgi:hypothetical protein